MPEVLGIRATQAAVVAAFILDGLACFCDFLLSITSKSEAKDPDEFESHNQDSLFWYLARVTAFPLLTSIAYFIYNRTTKDSPLLQLQNREESNTQLFPGGGNAGELQVPLRSVANGAGPQSDAASTASVASTASSQVDVKSEHAAVMKRAERRKNVIMYCTFAVATAMILYNGLKCVKFHYSPRLLVPQGMCYALIMVLINAEYFLLLDLLDKKTREQGELIQHLHMHPLFFTPDLKCHVCDVCHESTKGPHYIAYRCRTCDFDLCPRCYKKKDDPSARGYGARSVRRDNESLTTWTYFKRIVDLTLDFKGSASLALSCLVLTQSMQIWAPSVQGSIFDAIIHYDKDPSAGKGAFEYVMCVYVLVSVLQGLFGGLKSFAQELVLRQLACSVRTKLFQSVVRMDIAFFDSMHTGQLTSRLTNDASQMVQPLNTLMNDLIANLMLLAGGMVMAFHTSWKLSILALTVVPPITYSYRQYAQWGRKINRNIYCAYGEANSTATEAIHNIRTVRGFSTEAFETGKYDESISVALKNGKKNAYVGASVQAFSTYLNLGTAVLILWYGGNLAMDAATGETKYEDAMTPGSLITFQLYWNMMNSAFISLGNVFNDLIRSSSAAERVISLIDARPEVDPDEGQIVDRRAVKGHLKLKGVEFRYRTRPENLVLKGIDLEMQPGTVTALVGKSGGGKSTLVHLLMRFYEPTQGQIMLDGLDMREMSSKSVRAFCGFVAQDTQLFAKSVEENLAYGLGREYTHEEVVHACEAANAHEFIMETEDQYETRVGERGMMLSGGQRQRLAIARCFLRRPRLLFLDEATSALDAENEALVQQALDTLIDELKCTVVVIAHRLSTVIGATQIAVVHKGAIFERGTHETLMQEGGVYAQLVQRQLSREKNTAERASVDTAAPQEKKGGGGGGGGKGMQNEIDDLISELETAGKLPGS